MSNRFIWKRVTRFAVVLGLFAVLAGQTALAAPADDKPVPKVDKQADIASLVPSAIRDKGELTVVMTTSSPPAHFTTREGMKGLDHDLAIAIADVLGLKAKVVGVPIDQVIPGLQAHRYDVVVSQFKPTTARGKVLDFVDYASTGTSLGVLGGNPEQLTPDDLCGTKIGAQKGSSQAIGILPELSDQCVNDGKKPIEKKTFRDSTTALLALRSKRVDGVLIDSPVMGYAAEQSDKVAVAGKPLLSNPVGIGVLKGSGLAKPIQKALQYLKDKGVYQKIFENWGMGDDQVSDFAINHLQEN